MALILRQVGIDVVCQQKPLDKLGRMNGAFGGYKLSYVKLLTMLDTTAEAPNDAGIVH